MRCPSCNADVRDPEAAFCSRCGSPLGSDEVSATSDLQRPRPVDAVPDASASPASRPAATTAGDDTVRAGADAFGDVDDGPTGRAPAERLGVRDVLAVGDVAAAARRSIVAGGWTDAAGAALLAFAATLVVGATLLIAAKLQQPQLGSGSDVVSILTAIVILTLGSLGAAVNVGGLEVSALPLGALMASGAAIAWAARMAVRRRDVAGLRGPFMEGVKVGVLFGVVCLVAALLFRLGGGKNPVSVPAVQAFLAGATWGILFGALGGVVARASPRALLSEALGRVKTRSRFAYDGLLAGGVMLLTTVVLAGAALLAWLIVALARGATPKGFGWGDAVAALVYVVAFAPNVIVAIAALSLGAPIAVGAQVTFGGRVIGRVREFSLLDWGGDAAPWYIFLLVAIPIVAGVLGGFSARRLSADPPRWKETLAVAALTFAVALGVVAFLGEARLGAGLVRTRGFGLVAPDALLVFALGALWAAVFGYAGWRLGEAPAAAERARMPEETDTP